MKQVKFCVFCRFRDIYTHIQGVSILITKISQNVEHQDSLHKPV